MIERHPSYILVSCNRVSGHKHLFGSTVDSFNLYEFRIKEAHLHDGEISETSGRPIMILQMTSAQFVEMITMTNVGFGTPATLYYANGAYVEPPPVPANTPIGVEIDNLAEYNDELKASLAEGIDDAIKMVKELTASEKSKKPVLARLQSLHRQVGNIKGNLEFRKDMVREALEKTVHAAKVEIMSSIQLACNTLGLHALKDRFKLGSGTTLSVELEE